MGLDWGRVGHLEKEALDGVVVAAARRAARRQWEEEAGKLSSLALMVQLKSKGAPLELWEMIQPWRAGGGGCDRTHTRVGVRRVPCGARGAGPPSAAEGAPIKGVAPGMQTAGCDLCRVPGPTVARWEHVFDGSCPVWRPIVEMWVARMREWYAAAGWAGAARGQGGWVALFGCAAPPAYRRGVVRMAALHGRRGEQVRAVGGSECKDLQQAG